MPGIQNNASTIKWLGGIGSTDPGDRVSLNHVAGTLVELGAFLIDIATNNLQRGGNVATGETATSMKLVNLQTNATKMSLDIEINSTYKFLNKGVSGVDYKRPTPYSFKTKFVSKKMALALLLWVKHRRVVTKYKPHSAYNDNLRKKDRGSVERKNQEIRKLSHSAESQKSLAYAISANIKKLGIKPTYFFSGKQFSAVEKTQKEQKKRFAAAFKLDIIENLKSN